MTFSFSAGVFEGKFELTYPVKPGTWHIVVDAFVSFFVQFRLKVQR